MALFLLRASGTWPGEVWQFTLHTESSGAVGDVSNNWGAALTVLWSGNGTTTGIGQYYPTTTVLTVATAAGLDMASGHQATRVDTNLNLPGTGTGAPLPPQVAVTVSLRTAQANRAGRGRFFLSSPTADALSDGVMLLAFQQAVVDNVSAMFDSLGDNGITPVIYHRPTASGPEDGSTTNLTGFDVGSIFDTQRRRRNSLVEERISGTI